MISNRITFLVSVVLIGGILPIRVLAEPMPIYVTPYYNSEGPKIKVGKYSRGLRSKEEAKFLKTISSMQSNINSLSALQMYVAAVRLYDHGYKIDAVKWFYLAQLRSRRFQSLLDQSQIGTMGSATFELTHAHNAFQYLAGDYINGYAFCSK